MKIDADLYQRLHPSIRDNSIPIDDIDAIRVALTADRARFDAAIRALVRDVEKKITSVQADETGAA